MLACFTYFLFMAFFAFIAILLSSKELELNIISVLLDSRFTAHFIGSFMNVPILKEVNYLIITLRLFSGLTLIISIVFIVSFY